MIPMKAAFAKKVRWSVKDYFRMAEAGLFDDRRVELIHGEVIEVPAQATPHRAAVTNGANLLLSAFRHRVYGSSSRGHFDCPVTTRRILTFTYSMHR